MKDSSTLMHTYKYVFLIQLFLSICIYGCAVNTRGLVETNVYENESAYLIELEAWGVHLSTLGSDGGVSVGRIRKIYITPKSETEKEDSAGGALLEALASPPNLRKMNGLPSNANFEKTVAIIDRISGGKLYGNSWRGVGLVLGVQNHSAIRLPRDFKGILAINVDTELEHLNSITIQEEKR